MRKHIVFLTILVLVLSACSTASRPDRVVHEFLEAMVQSNFTAASKLLDGTIDDLVYTPELEESTNLAPAILSRLSFSILARQVSGRQATVSTLITAPNMQVVLDEALAEAIPSAYALAMSGKATDQDIEDIFLETLMTTLNSSSTPSLAFTVSIQLEHVGRKWLIKPDASLSKALTGGLSEIAGLAQLTTALPVVPDVATETSLIKRIPLNVREAQGGLEIAITEAEIYRKLRINQGLSDAIILRVDITNTSEQTMSVYPDQGIIVTYNGEQIVSELSKNSLIGGPISPGAKRTGTVTFPLNLSQADEVSSITYYVEPPHDNLFVDKGSRYSLNISFGAAAQSVTRAELLSRAYADSRTLISGCAPFRNRHVGKQVDLGPIRLHIIDIILLKDFPRGRESADVVGLTLAVENTSAGLVVFYPSQGMLATNTETNLYPDMQLSQHITGDFYPHSIKVGTNFYVLNSSSVEDLTELKLSIEGSYDVVRQRSLAAGKTVTITLE